MARTSMGDLIAETRVMCELGTADYTVGGVTYWTDDQVQTELDKHRLTVRQEILTMVDEYTNGTTEWRDYYWSRPDVEQYDADNGEIFHLEDVGGTVVGTADYSINYDARHIRFNADTLGSAYYLSYRSYDLNRVASTIWKKKASHVANRFDIKSDNHDLKASQLVQHYLAMAKSYAKEAGPKVVKMIRSDLNG